MPDSKVGSVAFLITLLIVLVGPLVFFNHMGRQAVRTVHARPVAQNNTEAEAAMVLESGGSLPAGLLDSEPNLEVTVITPAPAETNETEVSASGSQQEQIDNYIKTIFGKDATVAIAVQRVECNPQNKQYPKCVYHTEHEYSVGIFQINLYNSSHWIHAKKVPGETMEEKVEWLKNPYHNTLIAYKIFTDSGFNPWSGFTSGRYEAHL